MSIDSIFKYIVFTIGCIAAYFDPIMLTVHVVIGLFVADFITGVSASFCEGKSFQSSIARWSFVKLIVYLGHATLVFFVCERMGIDKETTISIVKIVIWAVIYVEGLSVNENLLRMFPHSKFLQFMHYMLSVEFLKYIPFLADFFKKDKNDLNQTGENYENK